MTQWFIYLREMTGSMSYPRHIVELMTYSDAFTPQLTECHDPRSQARRSSTADLDSKFWLDTNRSTRAPHILGLRAKRAWLASRASRFLR